MILATVSGHRPEKIPDPDWVREKLAETYDFLEVGRIYQGMASGVDLWSAFVAYRKGLPFLACRPWAGHRPRRGDETAYENALKHAEEVIIVDPAVKYPGPWVYQKRNKYMIERSDVLISVWDRSPGGTRNAVEHAKKLGMTVFNIDPLKRSCDFLVEQSI